MRNELQNLINSVETKEEMIDLIQSLYFKSVGNRIVDSDSYKASHWKQYPPNTTGTFSYLESRGSDIGYEESIFFGLQYILKKYFAAPLTVHEVKEAQKLVEAHGEPFNYDGWMHIVEDHGGNIPLRIRAVPEGTIVPLHNVLMTVETTCDKCYWVASYFETALMRVWYPITVSTQSYYIKKMIKQYLDISADDPDNEIASKLHDFGSRGVSSKESAGLGGLSHLINFMGTDTMHALEIGRDYYHEPMTGDSIPAGEHSTFQVGGVIMKLKPTAIC
jgi:nicotinamide phosphoribosyltransferase